MVASLLHLLGVFIHHKKQRQMKRFTDTDIWKKEWFMGFPARIKLLWKFITDDCDAAGVWEPNFQMASLFVGEKVTESDLKNFGDRIEKLPNGRYWLTSFIDFQYSGIVSEKSPAHKKIIQSLKKNSLYNRVVNRVCDRVSDTQQEEEEDKDKEEDKEKDKDEGGLGETKVLYDGLCYDAQKSVTDSKIWFDQICMTKNIPEEHARDALRKYHLWLVEKDRYPMSRKQVFAGFEKWLMNEKQFSSNGTHKKSSSGGRGSAGRNIVLEDIERDIKLTAARTRDA
jgi:hypothetical protein